jgi:hypothetical protein
LIATSFGGVGGVLLRFLGCFHSTPLLVSWPPPSEYGLGCGSFLTVANFTPFPNEIIVHSKETKPHIYDENVVIKI